MTNEPGAPSRVSVALGERSYDIVIGNGLLRDAGTWAAPLLSRPHAAIVTDSTVAALHLPTLEEALDSAGIGHRAIVLDPGEATKAFTPLARSCSTTCSMQGSSAATRSSPSAAASSAISPASPPAFCTAASTSFSCRRRCWRRSTARSAARPALTRGTARTSSEASISRGSSWPIPAFSIPCRAASCFPATPRPSNTASSTMPISSRGWRRTGRPSSPAMGPHGARRSLPRVAPRLGWWRRTSATGAPARS